MKKILIDTNALMAILEFHIDIFSELERSCNFKYKIYVLNGTLDELEEIKETQRGKYRRAAQLALSVIKNKNISIIHKKGFVDDILVEYSQKGALVLTQDVGLKRRLAKPYLTIRQKKRIVMMN